MRSLLTYRPLYLHSKHVFLTHKVVQAKSVNVLAAL